MLTPASSTSVRQLRKSRGSAAQALARTPTSTSIASSNVKKTPSMSLDRAVSLDLRRLQQLRSFVKSSNSDTGSTTLVSRDEEEGEVVASVSSSSSSPLVVVCPLPPPSSNADNNTNKKRLALFVASAALAHPDKAHYGGEDAWFHSPVSGTIGVADGVGGWADSGICPAEYARELMAAARSAAEGVPPKRVTVESLAEERGGTTATNESSSSDGEGRIEGFGVPLSCFDAAGGGAPAPVASAVSADAVFSEYSEDGGGPSLSSLLSSSSSSTPPASSSAAVAPPPLPPPSLLPTVALSAAHAAVRLPGSATACVVTLDEKIGTLHGVSVGDAGVLVVRKRRSSSGSSRESDNASASGIVLFRSRPTYHSFDCPRQLAAAPEHVEWSDEVGDGESFEVEGLEEGDVVIVASDGVFDNAWIDELLALLPDFPNPEDEAEAPSSESASASGESETSAVAREVAVRIARLAAHNSRDELYPSPYAAEAAAAGVASLTGEPENAPDLGAAIGSAVSSFAKLFGASRDEDEDEREEATTTGLVGGKLDDITVVVAVVGRV